MASGHVAGGETSGRDCKPAIEIYSGRTPELMHLATCCMACSGSVSMELLYYTKPTVIHYWISPLAYAVQKRFRKVKYITLVNLLSSGELYPADLSPYDPSQPGAEKVLFPEYLTCEDKSAAVAGHVIQWLKDPAALARQVAALGQLKAEVAHGGASARAAEYILHALASKQGGLSSLS
jgi:lipid-A-disaccharide synthase